MKLKIDQPTEDKNTKPEPGVVDPKMWIAQSRMGSGSKFKVYYMLVKRLGAVLPSSATTPCQADTNPCSQRNCYQSKRL